MNTVSEKSDLLRAVRAHERKGGELPSVDAALAYADGYVEALNDCDRADVADLIRQLGSERTRCAFESARADVAERRHAEQAAYIAELEDKLRAALSKASPESSR